MNEAVNINEFEDFIKIYQGLYEKRFKENDKVNNIGEIDGRIHSEVFFSNLENIILDNIENEANKAAYLNNWIALLKLSKLEFDKEQVYSNIQSNTSILLYSQIQILIEKLEVFKEFDYTILNKNSFNASETNISITEEMKKFKKVNFRNEDEFGIAISYLHSFFEGKNRVVKLQIPIIGVVKKEFCSSLGNIWRGNGKGKITDEYIEYCVQLFSIFKDENINDLKSLDRLKSYFRITRYRK